jgi:hypothetical protein
MLNEIMKESLTKQETLDRNLEVLKEIIWDLESGALNAYETYRVGNTVFVKVENTDLAEPKDCQEFLRIAKEKLKYFVSYLYESSFGLYDLSPQLEDYYLQYGYIAMKIGKPDISTYNKY